MVEVGHVIQAKVIRAFDYGLWLKAEREDSEILVRIIDLPVDPPVYSAKRFSHVGKVHRVELFHFDSENGYYHGRILSEEKA